MISKIYNAIKVLMTLLTSIVKGVADLIGMLPDAAEMLINSIGYLPTMFVTAATATVTILVIFLIVGRSHS